MISSIFVCLLHFGNVVDSFPLGNLNFDPSVIYTGLFDPNNVLVHIMQNVFNVIASTLFWIGALLILGPSVGGRDSGGRRRTCGNRGRRGGGRDRVAGRLIVPVHRARTCPICAAADITELITGC